MLDKIQMYTKIHFGDYSRSAVIVWNGDDENDDKNDADDDDHDQWYEECNHYTHDNGRVIATVNQICAVVRWSWLLTTCPCIHETEPVKLCLSKPSRVHMEVDGKDAHTSQQ